MASYVPERSLKRTAAAYAQGGESAEKKARLDITEPEVIDLTGSPTTVLAALPVAKADASKTVVASPNKIQGLGSERYTGWSGVEVPKVKSAQSPPRQKSSLSRTGSLTFRSPETPVDNYTQFGRVPATPKSDTKPNLNNASNPGTPLASNGNGAVPTHSNGVFEPAENTVSAAPVAAVSEPKLCPEQRALVDLILTGANVFYTGSAGCGKSTVLRVAVTELQNMGKNVRICAPTGRAAVDIGGQTIHAFAGITPDSLKLPLEKLKQKAQGKISSKRFSAMDVLIIDEISMVENQLLERLSKMITQGRYYQNLQRGLNTNLPFGGVQLVFLGDFFQLPPVKPFEYCLQCGRSNLQPIPGRVYKCPSGHGEFPDSHKWAFRASCWREASMRNVMLRVIHRQRDSAFISLLEKCRSGAPFDTQQRHTLLNHTLHEGFKPEQAVQLFATRDEVRRVNEAAFARLPGQPRRFSALDGIQILPEHEAELSRKRMREPSGVHLSCLREHRFEATLDLKIGAQVVLLVNLNMEQGLVNGTQGTVVGWQPFSEASLPEPSGSSNSSSSFASAGEEVRRVPKTAKQRGMEALFGAVATAAASSAAGTNSTNAPASPSKTLNVRPLIHGEHSALKASAVAHFARNNLPPQKAWPLVRFNLPSRHGSAPTVTLPIIAECSVTELMSLNASHSTSSETRAHSLLTRTQIPLLPAWAMSIHKAQGMTLDRVVVDLSRSFEAGQVYVALSRVRSLEGLKVVALGGGQGGREVEGPDEEVISFLEEAVGAEQALKAVRAGGRL